MSNQPKPPTADQVPASQHLSVRPDDGRPPELRFMFESPTQSRVGSAFGASVVGHAGFIGLWVSFSGLCPRTCGKPCYPTSSRGRSCGLPNLVRVEAAAVIRGQNRPSPPSCRVARKISVPAVKPESRFQSRRPKSRLRSINSRSRPRRWPRLRRRLSACSIPATRRRNPPDRVRAPVPDQVRIGSRPGQRWWHGRWSLSPGSGIINPAVVREVKPQIPRTRCVRKCRAPCCSNA